VALVLLAVAALAAGCGGDDDEPGETTAVTVTQTVPATTGPGTPATTGEQAPGDDAPADDAPAEGTPLGEPSATKAEYVKKADAACTKARKDIAAIGQEARKPQGIEKLADRLDQLADELRAAGPPREDRAEVAEFIGLLSELAADLRAVGGAVAGKDRDKGQELFAKLRKTGEAAAKAATDYGFKVCGRTTPVGG
jgi:acyl-CoA reductase-like NAD-dependent aldehyde dehydrogenase